MYGGNGREEMEGRSIGTKINPTGSEVFTAVGTMLQTERLRVRDPMR
jgi:hypothetical protein